MDIRGRGYPCSRGRSGRCGGPGRGRSRTSRASHRYELRDADRALLDEKLGYQGCSSPCEVGNKLMAIRDPDGVVPMKQAARVDSAGVRAWLTGGAGGWTLITPQAVRRGQVRRQQGRTVRDLAI